MRDFGVLSFGVIQMGLYYSYTANLVVRIFFVINAHLVFAASACGIDMWVVDTISYCPSPQPIVNKENN